MNTITLTTPGQFDVSDTKAPDSCPPGHALVRVHRIGICGTDLHAFRGKQPFFTYPRVLGHELGVEVVEVAPNNLGIKKGDRCSVEPYMNCQDCGPCRRNMPNCCINLKVLGVHIDGGMREFITLPIRKLHKSDKLSLDQLALVETLGIGAHAIERAKVQKGEDVLIIGSGPIGLAVTQFAQVAGANVTVADTNAARLEFCKSNLGVKRTVLFGADVAENTATIGELPLVVFDATGNPQSMANAFYYYANGGRLVFVGLFVGNVTFDDPNFHKRETTLLASRNSTPGDFTRIISLMEKGEIDTSPWITHRAPASRMIADFPKWLDPATGVIKAVVEF